MATWKSEHNWFVKVVGYEIAITYPPFKIWNMHILN